MGRENNRLRQLLEETYRKKIKLMQGQDTITWFGLIRHAQTRWNREKRIQGLSDSPLTADGESQAARWGQLLAPFAWDRIIASNTGRALKTAKIINDGLKDFSLFD